MGRVLVVAGASGGVGTSVLATAVAVRAARAGVSAALLDGCPLGGGLDVVLGAEQADGLRWDDLGRLVGSADGSALLAGLPHAAGVPVLSFGRSGRQPPADVADAVLHGVAATADVVVVDVPGSGGAVAEAAWERADRGLLVAGVGMRPLAALASVGATVQQARPDLDVGVCLRGASVGPAADLVEDELGWPVVAVLADDRRVDADLAHGIPPAERGRGSITTAADQVLGWALGPDRGRR